MRGPLCKVCTSPLRKDIDADMLSGTPLRQLSIKYGITKSTLHNHRVRCQGIAPQPAYSKSATPEQLQKVKEQRQAASLPSRVAALENALPTKEELALTLESCIERLDAIVARNEEEGGVDVVAISGLSGIRQAVSDLAKLAGHVGTGSQANVQVAVGVSVSAGDIATALASQLQTVSPSHLIEVTADE